MIANGADFGSVLAHHDVTAVEALPNSVAFAAEYQLAFYVSKEFAVAFFVFAFNGCHEFKLICDFFKTFFTSYFSKLIIHVCLLKLPTYKEDSKETSECHQDI